MVSRPAPLPHKQGDSASSPASPNLVIHWTVQVCCCVQVGVNVGSLANRAG